MIIKAKKYNKDLGMALATQLMKRQQVYKIHCPNCGCETTLDFTESIVRSCTGSNYHRRCMVSFELTENLD